MEAPSFASDVAQAVRDLTEEYVDFLCRLARIETPSTDPHAQEEALDLLAEALDAVGCEAVHLPGDETGGSLYARPRGRDRHRPAQLLLGHVDTVWPHGTLARMPVVDTVDASGRRVVRGPGTFDMKAGLTSIVIAMRALNRCGLRPPAAPTVLVTTDEEIGSHESRRHIERLAKASARVFVLEPALGLDGAIKTERKGTGELEIVAYGRGDGDGGNVVLELSRLIQHLYQLNDPDRGVTLNVGTIDAQQADAPDDVPTSNGASPHVPQGRLSIDVRVPTHDDAVRVDRAIRRLESSTPGVRLEVHGGIERPPLVQTPRNRRLWQQAQVLGASIGLDLHEGRAGGASDGNFTSLHAPTLDGLGAVGDGAHATHEFIDVDRTVDRCALLALLLMSDLDAGDADADT